MNDNSHDGMGTGDGDPPNGRVPDGFRPAGGRGPYETPRRWIEDGARALDELVHTHVATERTAILRCFHQTEAKSDGPLAERWWQVLSDSSAALQLQPSVLDCSIDQVIRLARDGAELALFVPPQEMGSGQSANAQESTGGWVVLRCPRNKRFLWWDAASGQTREIKSVRRLRSMLAPFAFDERIRCVAFYWKDFSLGNARSNGSPMRPVSRVQQILRAEWSDIYLVLLFAFITGLLMLATPIAVESLVNTVAFGRYLQPIVMLSLVLLTFLGFNAAIKALQTFIVEIIQQRLFARVAADFAHRIPRRATGATEQTYVPELVNRFFDVVSVQKISAFLLLDGINLVLSAVIGMAVLGFYHPFLLGFDAVLLAAVGFMILVLGRGAIQTAIKESKSKYYMASWLEDVARCPTTFSSAAGKRLSVCRSDRLVHDYLVNRKKHFRVLFRQIIFALSLQAIASTILLGLGGYLVVIGELTLGQLVAAELIVTVIVGAFAKMGKHLESFYDLCASVDKLGALFDLPMARPGTILQSIENAAPAIELQQVSYKRSHSGGSVSPVSVDVPGSGRLAIYGPTGSGKSTIMDLIHGSRRPGGGQLKVNGIQPCDLQSDDFWSHVELVRDGETFAGTIEENIHLQRSDVSGQDVDDALEITGLVDILAGLPDGLRTALASHGAPLSSNEVRLLLLTRAIASQPTLMMIDGVLDGLPDEQAVPILDYLTDPERPWTLVIGTGSQAIAERCSTILRLPKGEVVHSSRTAAADR